jgi:hypothetical protein
MWLSASRPWRSLLLGEDMCRRSLLIAAALTLIGVVQARAQTIATFASNTILSNPNGLAIEGNGNLYIANVGSPIFGPPLTSGDNRAFSISRVTPAGAVSNFTSPIYQNGSPTFSIFAIAGQTIPLQPAANRLVVQFHDQSGARRGSTSVAVETQ